MLSGLHHRDQSSTKIQNPSSKEAPNPNLQKPTCIVLCDFSAVGLSWALGAGAWDLFGAWSLVVGAFRFGVPSRTLTSNLTLRTRPLCVLSYGDNWCARPVTLRNSALI